MTTIKSQIDVLDNILALNLNISLWTARKKMSAEDFGNVELPPDDIATLGSKRVSDPEKIRIFSTIKARAFNYLDKKGVRFMGGWAIPESKAGEIANDLLTLKNEFYREKEEFLQNYETNLNSWIARHQEWSSIILRSVVSSSYVRSRMDFRWQIFKVSPLVENESHIAVKNAGLVEEVEGLANTLFSEVARSADEIWKKVYLGKNEVTHKALSPLRTLHNKLVGLTFIEPHVEPVAEIIQAVLAKVPKKGNIAGTELLMLQGLINLLRDSENLLLHSQKLIEGNSASSIVDELIGKHDFVPEIRSKSADTFPVLPPLPTKPVLPNLGLW